MSYARQACLAASLLLLGCAASPDGTQACTLAIRNVAVVPMDAERVLAGQSVLIEGDRIASIGPAGTVSTARCERVIDGGGAYLAPGLNDMHVHVETAALAEAFGLPPAPIDFRTVFPLYLAHGVTGVRVMSGAPDIIAFRESGAGPRPLLIVGSPMLSGAPPVLPEPATRIVETSEAARDAVRRYAADRYDFIKIRDNLREPVFRAVIEEARQTGLYVDGHILRADGMTIDDVLASGQKAFAHIDNFALELENRELDATRFAKALLACECFVTTTLSVEANALQQIDDYDAMLARPEMPYVHPLLKNAFWLKPNNPYAVDGAPRDFFKELLEDDRLLLKTFSDAGVRVVAGTDALSPMIIPGASLHDELALMIDAGLSPYQALAAATSSPAAFVPGFEDVGVLAPGRIANAVLVEANPLETPAVLRRPTVVILAGRPFERAELDRLLDDAAASFPNR